MKVTITTTAEEEDRIASIRQWMHLEGNQEEESGEEKEAVDLEEKGKENSGVENGEENMEENLEEEEERVSGMAILEAPESGTEQTAAVVVRGR